jgi:hypothetical protein
MLIIPRFAPRPLRRLIASISSPVRMAATGQSLIHYATISDTTGYPPNNLLRLGNNYAGWITTTRAVLPCGYFDNWRDEGGSLPTNPLDQRMISQASGVSPTTDVAWAKLFYGAMQARGGQVSDIAQRNSDLLLALNPQLTFIGVGESQIYGESAATLSGKLQTLVSTVLNGTASRVVLMVPFTRASIPGNSSSFVIGNAPDDALRQKLVDLAALLFAAYAGHARVKVFDPNPIITGGGTALNIPLPFYVLDHIHTTWRGAHAVGKAVAQLLQGWGYQDLSAQLYPLPALYNASTNPTGNAILNPTFIGTGGTKGAGVTGVLPDYHRMDRQSGDASVVASVETAGDGTKKLVLTFTAGTSVSSFDLQFTQTTNGSAELNSPFPANTWVRQHAFIEGSAYSDWRMARLWMQYSADSNFPVYGGNNFVYGAGRGTYSNEPTTPAVQIDNQPSHGPLEAWANWVESPPYRVINSGGTIRTRLQITIGVSAGTPVLKLSKPVIRPIADPRTAYGL